MIIEIEHQAQSHKLLGRVFVLICFTKNIVRIIRVTVELAVMCVLGVASQATESKISQRVVSRVRHRPSVLSNHLTQQGATSSSANSGQHQNRLYEIQFLEDQKSSPDVVMGMLPTIHLYVYALFDPGASLCFVTPDVVVKFSVSPKTLAKTFSFSTPMGTSILAKLVYKNYPVIVSQ